MKVLTFISSLSLKSGGPSQSVPLLVKGLASAGVDVTLMTIYSEDMNTKCLEGTSAKLKILDSPCNRNIVEEYIVSEKFDIIQLQSIWDIYYHMVAKIARKYHIPYIFTPRGMLEPWSLSQKYLKKKFALAFYQKRDLKMSACIYTTADMEADHVRELGLKVPVCVIPNGVDTETYPCRTSIDKVKKQILFLSRIHVKKGVEILIDSFHHMHKEFMDWKVVIVGNGEYDYINELKDRINRLGLQDCIEIKPPVYGEEKIKLYQESSIFCLPSFSENFGMVIVEAMSCGVPVLTTTNCPWQILNEKNVGWCVDLSVENIEKTLRNALSLPAEKLYAMGQRGSRLVYENFNYHNTSQKTKKLFEWLLKGGKSPEFMR